MSQWLDTKGGRPGGSLELGVPDELLGLPGVRFVLEALAGPSDDSVELKTESGTKRYERIEMVNVKDKFENES